MKSKIFLLPSDEVIPAGPPLVGMPSTLFQPTDVDEAFLPRKPPKTLRTINDPVGNLITRGSNVAEAE